MAPGLLAGTASRVGIGDDLADGLAIGLPLGIMAGAVLSPRRRPCDREAAT